MIHIHDDVRFVGVYRLIFLKRQQCEHPVGVS